MADNFEKVVLVGYTKANERIDVPVYVNIEFKDGALSLTGVVGPLRNGDCVGSCGQIVDELDDVRPADGWTSDMVRQLKEIWQEWHLNDMRPYSPEMKALGWDKEADEFVEKWVYQRKLDVFEKATSIKRNAMRRLEEGETVKLTSEEIEILNLPITIFRYCRIGEKVDDSGITDMYKCEGKQLVRRGHLFVREHPLGMLGRKVNPDDEYGYGDKWWRSDVPEDVLDWLRSLPEPSRKPAWV